MEDPELADLSRHPLERYWLLINPSLSMNLKTSSIRIDWRDYQVTFAFQIGIPTASLEKGLMSKERKMEQDSLRTVKKPKKARANV